jgi:hypothetical protein
VFIIIKSGTSPIQARNQRSYPGALKDKINPLRKIRSALRKGLLSISIS